MTDRLTTMRSIFAPWQLLAYPLVTIQLFVGFAAMFPGGTGGLEALVIFMWYGPVVIVLAATVAWALAGTLFPRANVSFKRIVVVSIFIFLVAFEWSVWVGEQSYYL